MITMTFDLSSTCIGVTFAQIEGKCITYGKTLAIIPDHLDGRKIGYTTKQPKNVSSNGATYKAFLKDGEFGVSKAEAEKRKKHYKSEEHKYLLKDIGKQCGLFLNKIKPDVVALEKNKSFNGILTTKLLAEIAGGLYFHCGANDVPLYDWDEATVRAKIRRDIPSFSYFKGDKQALGTKWEIFCRLREYFESEHPGVFNFDDMTMDESDSLAVFYYWLKEVQGD